MRGERPTPGSPSKRRILIVEDHPVVRRGLTALIHSEADLVVCAATASHRSGLEAIAASAADLVIVDLSLQDDEGLDVVQAIRARHDDLPILILSMHDAPVWAERAFRAGANGYVSKQEISETLLVAIRCLLGGDRYLSPRMRTGFDASWPG